MMTIKPRQMIVSSSKFLLKCPYTLQEEYICVHNTANDASAQNEASYHNNNNNATSYHFAIDDFEVVQVLPLNRNAFASGDGSKGDGNRKAIHIEICYSKSGGERYRKAEKLSVKFIAQLLFERGWNTDRVKSHKYFSEVGVKKGYSRYVKNCPHRIYDEGRWNSFIAEIQDELSKLKQPTKVETVKKEEEEELKFTSPTLKKKYADRVDSSTTAKLLDDAAIKILKYKSKLKDGKLSDGDLSAIAIELAVELVKQYNKK